MFSKPYDRRSQREARNAQRLRQDDPYANSLLLHAPRRQHEYRATTKAGVRPALHERRTPRHKRDRRHSAQRGADGSRRGSLEAAHPKSGAPRRLAELLGELGRLRQQRSGELVANPLGACAQLGEQFGGGAAQLR